VDARDRGGLFDIERVRFAIPGKDGYSRAVVDGDHNNVGPRIGFAYQLKRRWVLRGGYGIFYGLRDQNQEVTQIAENNPNTPALIAPTVSASRTVTHRTRSIPTYRRDLLRPRWGSARRRTSSLSRQRPGNPPTALDAEICELITLSWDALYLAWAYLSNIHSGAAVIISASVTRIPALAARSIILS
jgi:hypothetical protein